MKERTYKDIAYNRHSVKVYDPEVKISQDEMIQILDEAVKAPSSVNMQPWRFVVVQSQNGKEKLRPLIRFNQRQNDTSSAMILIFGDMQCWQKGEQIYGEAVERGLMPQDVKEELMQFIMPAYTGASPEKMNDIVKIDCSLCAMQLMLAARDHGYDTCPIGGFEHEQLAEAFGLDPERYVPVLIISIGKSDYETHQSVRLRAEEITKFI